jgi:hypothetical protein
MDEQQFSEPRERDFIGIAYEVMTSKYARNGDDPIEIGVALHEMEEVKYEMMRMGVTMGIRGKMAMIFSCLLVDELRKFTWVELMCYCNLFHIMIPVELLELDEQSDTSQLVIIIFNEHIRRLQRMRLKRYAAAIFFGTLESREAKRPQVFHIEDNDENGMLLSEQEIRDKGVEYWFPRVGGLRAHMLAERFDFFEALYMLMLAGTIDPRDSQKKGISSEMRFKITNDMQEEHVYQELAGFYFDSRDDARAYVTLDGIIFPYVGEIHEHFVPLNDFTMMELDILQLLCKQEGIDHHVGERLKPNLVIMFEWCVAQLGETFMSQFGNHRTIMEASKFETTSAKESPFYLHEGELVYFGKRDGMSDITVHTLQDLVEAFVEIPDASGKMQPYAYDPISILNHVKDPAAWIRYPRKVITRLLEIVLQSKFRSIHTSALEKKCRLVLESDVATLDAQRFQAELIKLLRNGNSATVKMILLKIFNAGIALSGLEVDPEDIFGEGVTQREANNHLLQIEEALMVGNEEGALMRRLLVVENYYDVNVVHYEDYNYELGNFIPIVRDMVNSGLSTMVIIAGRYLANTATSASYQIFGYAINHVSFSFEETGGLNDTDQGEDDLGLETASEGEATE